MSAKILIVDDEPPIIDMLSYNLKRGNYEVVVASDGEEALEKARADEVKVIYVQQQFSTQSAQAIAQAIDGVVVPMDPLARDYLENLRRMAQTIKKGLTDK